MSRDTIIPIIVDLMGAHWQQPPADEILVDTEYATMSLAAFNQLLQWDGPKPPSGFYLGKMWKSRVIRMIDQDNFEADYYLHWFNQAKRSGNWYTSHRLIVIHDWKALMGLT